VRRRRNNHLSSRNLLRMTGNHPLLPISRRYRMDCSRPKADHRRQVRPRPLLLPLQSLQWRRHSRPRWITDQRCVRISCKGPEVRICNRTGSRSTLTPDYFRPRPVKKFRRQHLVLSRKTSSNPILASAVMVGGTLCYSRQQPARHAGPAGTESSTLCSSYVGGRPPPSRWR